MTPQDAVLSAFGRARLREAARVAAVAAMCLGIAVVFTGNLGRSAPLAAVATTLAFVLVRFSALPARRALAFVLLGFVPLFAALIAQTIGHACTPAGCMSLCAPFCAAGGSISGALLTRVAMASRHPVRAWASGALLIGATGSIGCACVGASGIVGMMAGLVATGALAGIRVRLRASTAG